MKNTTSTDFQQIRKKIVFKGKNAFGYILLIKYEIVAFNQIVLTSLSTKTFPSKIKIWTNY